MKIESMLKEYKTNKTEIKLLQIEIEQIRDNMDMNITMNSTNFSAVDSGKCDSKGVSSKVEKDVLVREEIIAEIERKIRNKEREIQKVELLLETLTEDDRRFIVRRYVEGVSMTELSELYNVDRSTLYKRKDVIFLKLLNYIL